jgi:hypothetical protein
MLHETMERMEENIKLLLGDTESIAHGKKENKPISRRSLEKITIMRDSTEQLVQAENEDKDYLFIKDKLREIVRGN